MAGVTGPTLIIGRANGSTVMIKHDDVSRRHASVEVTAQGLVVRDLSTNGTFVDGRRVMGAQQLPFGKPIVVGPFTLRIRPPGVGGVRAMAGGMDAASKPIAVGGQVRRGQRDRRRRAPRGGRRPSPRSRQSPQAPRRRRRPRRRGPAKQLAEAAAKPKPVAAPSDLSDAERDRLKRWLRGLLLEALDLPSLRPEELQDKALAPRVLQLMDELLDEHARELPKGLDRGRLRKELADEVLGLGPLEDLLADVAVSEIMVVDRATIYVEKAGRLTLTGARFSSEDALRSAIERIVTPLGRRIDESTPMVDARLKDGSRVNAIIPPLALRGPVPHHPQVLAEAADRSTTSSASARSTSGWRASSRAAVHRAPQHRRLRRHRLGQDDAAQRAVVGDSRGRAHRHHRGRRRAAALAAARRLAGDAARQHRRARRVSRSATWCATRCACGPTASSSASAAAARRSTCCRP